MGLNIRQTKQCIGVVFVLISIHSTPLAIYYDEVNHHCVFISQIYSLYYLFVIIILWYGFIPTRFLLIFG